MKTFSFLLISIVLAISANDLASSYKIDYTNGHNKIHFENNRYLNGKPVNEPKIEEAIQTLSKLGFKPDNAKVLTESDQIEQHRQQMVQQNQNPQIYHQNQQQLQQQHQQFIQHQQQLEMQKRMPNMGPRDGVVNLSLRQAGKANTNTNAAEPVLDNQNHKLSELQELAGTKPSTGQNFQPSIDSITHQSQNNKAYEKLMSMRNYLPYFKAKYGLGDDFVDPMGEQIQEQNELLAMPLILNAARHQGQNAQTENKATESSGATVRPLSFAFAGNMNGGGYQDNYNPQMIYNAPPNNQQYPSQQYGNQYVPQGQQNYQLPPPPIQQYQPQPAAPQPAYVPTKESYSTSTGADPESSDIFITNINENYNNLNNTQTENTIAKSNNNDRTYNRNDDKAAYKTSSYV